MIQRMIGTLVNAAGIVIGGIIGLARPGFGLSRSNEDALKVVLAALTVFCGLRLTWTNLSGSWSEILKQLFIVIVAMILGKLAGRLLRLQNASNALGGWARDRISARKPGDLNRQLLGSLGNLGVPKVEVAVERVGTINPAVRLVPLRSAFSRENGAALLSGADAAVDALDTVTARVELARACRELGVPMVHGAIAGWYGQMATQMPGEDITPGDLILAAGSILRPQDVGGLLAVGIARLRVWRRPRVAILSTGNEIVDPGAPLGPGQIYDINRFTLSSVIRAHGGIAAPRPTAPDSLPELMAAVQAAATDDVIVFSGGSSVGERDLIMDALASLGEVIFHGIAVKPGKPTVFGRIGATPVLGMPGYPTSCLSNAYMLLIPLLRRLARLPEYRPQVVRVPLARRIVSTTGRHQFYTVRIENGAAVPAFKASGDITSMSRADGYIEIPPQTDIVEAGELVEVKLF